MCCADEYMPELELQTGPDIILFIEQAEKKKKGQEVCLKSPEILHSTSCADKQPVVLSKIP